MYFLYVEFTDLENLHVLHGDYGKTYITLIDVEFIFNQQIHDNKDNYTRST